MIKRANKVIQNRRVHSHSTLIWCIRTICINLHHTSSHNHLIVKPKGKLTDWARVISCLTQANNDEQMSSFKLRTPSTSDLPDRLPVRLNVWLTWEKRNCRENESWGYEQNERNNNNSNMHTHIINTLVYNSGKQEARFKWCFLSRSLSPFECWTKRLRKRTS